MSKLEVDAIEPQSGTTITIGAAGDTVNLVGTLQNNGSPLPGDISEVIAGTGLSGGGSTGAVTINIEAAQPTITSLGTITSFRSTGIYDNSSSNALFINSSNRVTVGTDSGYGLDNSADDFVVANTGSNSGMSIVSNASNSSSIFFTDTGNSSIGKIVYSHSSNDMKFTTTNSERMLIDSSGNVGIGTSSPSNLLHLVSSSNSTALQIANSSDTNGIRINSGVSGLASNALQFLNNSGDSLLIIDGTNKSTIIGNIGYSGYRASFGDFEVKNPDGSGNPGGTLVLSNTDGSIVSGQHLGNLTFASYDQSGASTTGGVASIKAIASETYGSTSGAYLSFLTHPSSANNGTVDGNMVENMRISADGSLQISGTPSLSLSFLNDSNTGIARPASDTLAFNTGGSEHMRIDSSGNLLVGKTATGITNAGVSVLGGSNAGTLEVRRNIATANSSSVGYISRGSSDGNILTFYKDNSSVGSIGVASSKLHIASVGNSGIRFRDDLNSITPCNSDGSNSDADQDLGEQGVRFRRLYLSEGIRLGGTGTANELDDYEEGTWTPTLTNETTAVYSNQTGWYRKIGNTVFIYFSVSLSSKGDISGSYTRIGSLPFTGSPTNRFGSGQIHRYRVGSSIHIQGIEFGGSIGTVGWITTGGGTQAGYLNTSYVVDNSYFEGFGIYRTA